jgi:hypothetical protein
MTPPPSPHPPTNPWPLSNYSETALNGIRRSLARWIPQGHLEREWAKQKQKDLKAEMLRRETEEVEGSL